jgi:hypothetical protein
MSKLTTNATGTSYRIDSANPKDIVDYEKWTPQQIANFLTKAGLGQYQENIIRHKISGRLAPLLTHDLLKEMGVHIVGDRLRIMAIVQALGHKARYDQRTKTFWEGTEQLYFTSLEQFCCTACGCCPADPSTYRLTSNHLRVKTVQPARIGPIRLCCCYQYTINNLDLTKVEDVDILGEPAPCGRRILCCAPGKDRVEIMTPTAPGGRMTLVLPQGEGERVTSLLLHQIEEAQLIERD